MIGNKNTIEQLDVALKSAQKDNRSIPHTLLTGAAGCGKTMTARLVSDWGDSNILEVAPETIKKSADLVPIIKLLDKRGYDDYGDKTGIVHPSVIFIDEIHRLPITGQEHLGILMEEKKLPVSEKAAKINPYDSMGTSRKGRLKRAPWFTLIGATTKEGMLSKPFRDRFKLKFIFTPYSEHESIEIVRYHAEKKKIKITDDAAVEIAIRGRGVPRILVTLLERSIDIKNLRDNNILIKEHVFVAVILLGIDSTGLSRTDIKILTVLYDSIDPIGLDNLSIITNESPETIKDSIEPYLIQRGLIVRMARGRKLSENGEQYLLKYGYIKPKDNGEWFDVTPDFLEKRRV